VLFYVLFVCKCVLLPGDNPTAVNKYIISYHHYHNRLISPSYLSGSIKENKDLVEVVLKTVEIYRKIPPLFGSNSSEVL
jgi:hypothetical protein